MTGRSIVELMFIPITIRNTNDTTEKNTIVVNIFRLDEIGLYYSIPVLLLVANY
jgi:hypothetical protein